MFALIVPVVAVLASTTPTDPPTESRPAAIVLNGEDAGEGRLEIEGDSIWIPARLLRARGSAVDEIALSEVIADFELLLTKAK